MTIRFISKEQASGANASLSDALIQELTSKSSHPLAQRRGLGMVIIPSLPEDEIKLVVNKDLKDFSPVREIIVDKDTVDKIAAEIGTSAPKVAKASKKKS